MLGGNTAHKASFRQLTPLLRQGQSAAQAFTNAFHTSLPAMKAKLRRYLARGKFEPLELPLSANLETARNFVMRRLTPTEVWLGFFELVQAEDLPAAEKQIARAIQLEPENQAYLLSLAQVRLAKPGNYGETDARGHERRTTAGPAPDQRPSHAFATRPPTRSPALREPGWSLGGASR